MRSNAIAAILAANDEISRLVLLLFLTTSISNITDSFLRFDLDMHQKYFAVTGPFTGVLCEIRRFVTPKMQMNCVRQPCVGCFALRCRWHACHYRFISARGK